MTLSFFITVIPDHDKPQPPGCLLEKQLVAAGNVRQRIPADTQRLLRESISEFNADADKG
ncbi:hypothetical protein P1J22_27825 (plasmid) [Escherichia coli]|nr:hypothetical protein [Escherichia coli]WES52065.1 hypothetical protein P1J22_27825 [Escherichia coli]WES57412.1 hypothetical protein P1J23_27810 [Escherichia coli]